MFGWFRKRESDTKFITLELTKKCIDKMNWARVEFSLDEGSDIYEVACNLFYRALRADKVIFVENGIQNVMSKGLVKSK